MKRSARASPQIIAEKIAERCEDQIDVLMADFIARVRDQFSDYGYSDESAR